MQLTYIQSTTRDIQKMSIHCPSCGSVKYKKNGHTRSEKQNHMCIECKRQFVLNPEDSTISEEKKKYIEKSLIERISLRGICRTFGVSLPWLLSFMCSIHELLPDDLHFVPYKNTNDILIKTLDVEEDEMWGFVGSKKNKQWLWIALDSTTRQVIAFFVGDRSRNSAMQLWERIPDSYKEKAEFYTDLYESYVGVIPEKKHHRVTKDSGKTNHVERLNCTIRQRVSRLVRETLSFSKKLENHIGAIKHFFCNYNLTIRAALPL